MSVSAMEHPFLKGLLGQGEVARFFSLEEDVAAMLAFEGALAKVEREAGIISKEAEAAIQTALANFNPDVDALNEGAARDGVVVPELLRQIRGGMGKAFRDQLHLGATSQDVIDSSLSLRLKGAGAMIAADLSALIHEIEALEMRLENRQIMGRTRMQRALPIPLSHRIDGWRRPLKALADEFAGIITDAAKLQFAGAVGTLDQFGEQGPHLRAALARELSLTDPAGSWHTDRQGLVNLAGWMSRLTGSVGKLGLDVIQMSVNEVQEVYLIGGGGSSAMPHKQNPVKGEVLVSLARYNAVQISGMHQSMLHEFERSGSGWTLEWMILPSMVIAGAASIRCARELLAQIADIPDLRQAEAG